MEGGGVGRIERVSSVGVKTSFGGERGKVCSDLKKKMTFDARSHTTHAPSQGCPPPWAAPSPPPSSPSPPPSSPSCRPSSRRQPPWCARGGCGCTVWIFSCAGSEGSRSQRGQGREQRATERERENREKSDNRKFGKIFSLFFFACFFVHFRPPHHAFFFSLFALC